MTTPVVFFDLETTGFPRKSGPIPDIISIGAVDSFNESQSYYCVLEPILSIEGGASRVNGFCKDECGVLLYNGEEVDSTDMRRGLINFVHWLQHEYDEPVLLVAHNCFRFDAKVLLLNFQHYNVKYERAICGFADSMRASQDLYDGPYSLQDLLERVNMDIIQSHNALEDAKGVRTLVRRMAAQNNLLFQPFVKDSRWYKSLYEAEVSYGIIEEVESDMDDCEYVCEYHNEMFLYGEYSSDSD